MKGGWSARAILRWLRRPGQTLELIKSFLRAS